MADVAISDEEFRRLCDFLYRRTGMVFNDTKRYYVDRRLGERMAATQSRSFASYFAQLRTNAAGEIEQFVNAFTVNETYFFREDHQLRCLSRDLIEARLTSLRPGAPLRIWSAPCSTGEEAYSIAIWLLENWSKVDDYEIEIVGSDIDTRALAAANEGVYNARTLMRLDQELVNKYFRQTGSDRWQILDDLRQSIRFSPVNLIDAAQMRAHGHFDVIFCRNVLIYFDDASRRAAAENLYDNLAPGGFICLGHTESMSRISPLFRVRRFEDAIVYQRPAEDARDKV